MRGLRSIPVWRTFSHNMQETTILVLLSKPRAAWNKVGLYLRWKWVLCWWCQFVLVCVVFVVLLVASVFASMRWLSCGGDGSKKKNKTKSVISKNVPRENLSPFQF